MEKKSKFVLKNKLIFYQKLCGGDAPDNAIDGRYICLPIVFEQENPVLKWSNEWSLN